MLTYSELGKNGALGNQLWQIAGTVGKTAGMSPGPGVFFPHWFYEDYFNLDQLEFSDTISSVVVDLAPDYLQDINLWWDIREFIRDQFKPTELVEKQLEHYGDLSETLAVHVRRANNLALPDHHPVPGLEYFEFALDMLGRWGGKDVLVFSDSLEWCKDQKCFKHARFADGIPSYVNVMELTQYAPLNIAEAAFDLHAMSKCRYHIISNSSFSWWGAFLGNSEACIYPERWYGKALKHIDVTTELFNHLNWEAL